MNEISHTPVDTPLVKEMDEREVFNVALPFNFVKTCKNQQQLSDEVITKLNVDLSTPHTSALVARTCYS
jgi:hypothetical protein